jgi:hypothetical protein
LSKSPFSCTSEITITNKKSLSKRVINNNFPFILNELNEKDKLSFLNYCIPNPE